jgi:hypothetical protein
MQRESQTGHEFSIFWVPRKTLVSEKILEEAGVLGDTTTSEFPLYFLPLEKDLLSLELEDSFSRPILATRSHANILTGTCSDADPAKAWPLSLESLERGTMPRRWRIYWQECDKN